jgi:hypothetical protein
MRQARKLPSYEEWEFTNRQEGEREREREREGVIVVLDRVILPIPEVCEIRYGLVSELTSKLRTCRYTVVIHG